MATVSRYPITSRIDWLALRRHDITASEIGALFADHPYRTVYGLSAEKSGVDLPGPDPESSVVRRGNALERVVAEEVKRQRPHWEIVKATEYLRDPEHRVGATPDFWFTDRSNGRTGVLQTKTVSSGKFRREWRDEDDIVPPLWIALQVVTETMLADATFGAIAALEIGEFAFDCHIVEIARQPGAERRILKAAKKFWDDRAAGIEPQPDFERDGDLIALMHRTPVKGKSIDLRGNNRIIELLETRKLHGGLEKKAETQKKIAEAELRQIMGDAEVALVDGWRVTLKTTNRKEVAMPATNYRTLRTRRVEHESSRDQHPAATAHRRQGALSDRSISRRSRKDGGPV